MVIRAVPVLPANDIDETVGFWRDALGFSEVFRSREYGIVERDGTAVHFFPSEVDPFDNDGGCRLGVDSVDHYYEEYSEHVFAAHRTEFVVDLPVADRSMAPSGLRLVERP